MGIPVISDLGQAPVVVPPDLLGLVGQRVATAAVRALAAAPGATGIDGLERLGLQLQSVARVVARREPGPVERLDLRAACHQALAGWPSPVVAAVTLAQSGPTPVGRVSAEALGLVLDLLIDHGVQIGERVAVGAGWVGQPALPSVQVDVARRPGAVDDGVLPALAALVARACGWTWHPVESAPNLSYVVSAPRELPQPLPAGAPADVPRTPVAAGGRVLIVDPQTPSRLKAHALLQAAGIRVDAVVSVAQAQAARRDGEPDVLVTGVPVDNAEVVVLIHEVRAANPQLRVIELVNEENAFAFSAPGLNAPGRLSRSELDTHLTAAVSQEIYSARLGS